MDFFELSCTANPSPWVIAALHQNILVIKLFIEALASEQKERRKFVLNLEDVRAAVGAAVFQRNKQIIDLLYKAFPELKGEEFIITGYFTREIIEFILQNNLVCYDKKGTHFVNAALSLGYNDIINRLIQSSYAFEKIYDLRPDGESEDYRGTNFFQTACLVANIPVLQKICAKFSVNLVFANPSRVYIAQNTNRDKKLEIVQFLITEAIKQNVGLQFYVRMIRHITISTDIADKEVVQLLEPIFRRHPNILYHCSSFIYELLAIRPLLAQQWESRLAEGVRDRKCKDIIRLSDDGNISGVAWMLRVYPESINAVDYRESSPLHIACVSRSDRALEIIDLLCKTSPELITKRNCMGQTPFESILVYANNGMIQGFSEVSYCIEKIKLLLQYNEHILKEKSIKWHQPLFGRTNSFLLIFAFELAELYESTNLAITTDFFDRICNLSELPNFLSYLEKTHKPKLPFAVLELLFNLRNAYEKRAEFLTRIGLLYSLPELIHCTDGFRSKAFLQDLLFLFANIPDEIAFTSKIVKKDLNGDTLIDGWNKLKECAINCLRKSPEDAGFKAVYTWLGQSRISLKKKSRMYLLFSDTQIASIIVDQLQAGHDVTKLITLVAEYFNLKKIITNDGSTLLHHAIKYQDCKAVLLLCSIDRSLLHQKNKNDITPMDLLPAKPGILHRIMGLSKIQHL